MVKDLVANSPFINIEFIKSSEKINVPDSKVLFDYYKLDSNTISFQINSDFSDYRITPYFSDDQIGDLKIQLFTSGSRAWSFSVRDDLKVINAMKTSLKMEVIGTSSRGTITKDTYSLLGFSKAYQKINEACQKK